MATSGAATSSGAGAASGNTGTGSGIPGGGQVDGSGAMNPATGSGAGDAGASGSQAGGSGMPTVNDAGTGASGNNAGDASPGPCANLSLGCSGTQPQICANGQWQNIGSACVPGSAMPDCLAGACVACVPKATRCVGNGVGTCGADGQWYNPIACAPATPFCLYGACTAAAPSCQKGGPGLSDCGPNQESCCTSLEVPGGTFYRSYDGVSCPGGPGSGTDGTLATFGAGCYTSQAYPTTVSGFRLDKYEITCNRYLEFQSALTTAFGPWQPPPASGKHTHLNGGLGLSDSSKPGSYEAGWNAAWTASLLTTTPGACETTTGVGTNRPAGSLSWYQAYAFCIWDGGFLPSEAEWNYAASGGSEQRVYPWSNPPSSTLLDCSYANYTGCVSPIGMAFGGQVAVGTESPKGDGKWGQTDLAGNAVEWVLDLYAGYVTPCSDCADVGGSSGSRMVRGGAINFLTNDFLLNSARRYLPVTTTGAVYNGARCARAP
jgi:sulfatase modifying factor 1